MLWKYTSQVVIPKDALKGFGVFFPGASSFNAKPRLWGKLESWVYSQNLLTSVKWVMSLNSKASQTGIFFSMDVIGLWVKINLHTKWSIQFHRQNRSQSQNQYWKGDLENPSGAQILTLAQRQRQDHVELWAPWLYISFTNYETAPNTTYYQTKLLGFTTIVVLIQPYFLACAYSSICPKLIIPIYSLQGLAEHWEHPCLLTSVLLCFPTHSTSVAATLGLLCKRWVKEALCHTPVISAAVYPSKFVKNLLRFFNATPRLLSQGPNFKHLN